MMNRQGVSMLNNAYDTMRVRKQQLLAVLSICACAVFVIMPSMAHAQTHVPRPTVPQFDIPIPSTPTPPKTPPSNNGKMPVLTGFGVRHTQAAPQENGVLVPKASMGTVGVVKRVEKIKDPISPRILPAEKTNIAPQFKDYKIKKPQ